MKTAAVLALSASAAQAFVAPVVRASTKANAIRMDSFDELQELAVSQNPVVKYWDPLSLAEQEFWGQSQEATIGFLRHAEMKHGRVAMAGFVGFWAHASGIVFPWRMTGGPDGQTFAEIAAGAKSAAPGDIWDGIPEVAKWQILFAIGTLEFYSEIPAALEQGGQTHYMRGGKPGFYPPFTLVPHWTPFNLFDPFGFTEELTEEDKARKLNIEVNNGRLAMFGLFSLLAASKVEGSVPTLAGVVLPYDGDYMAPFGSDFSLFG